MRSRFRAALVFFRQGATFPDRTERGRRIHGRVYDTHRDARRVLPAARVRHLNSGGGGSVRGLFAALRRPSESERWVLSTAILIGLAARDCSYETVRCCACPKRRPTHPRPSGAEAERPNRPRGIGPGRSRARDLGTLVRTRWQSGADSHRHACSGPYAISPATIPRRVIW